MAVSTDTGSPASKRRWLRRVGVIAIVVAGLALLAVAVIQIVLWTNIPRDLVANQLERQLGVRVDLATVRAGWDGQTSLEDLRLTFPLAEAPFLVAPSMRVTHTGLFKIIIGRPLEIAAATVDEPTLLLQQAPDGDWNIQQLGQRPPGSDDAPRDAGPRSIDLPDLEINNATLIVIDADNRGTTIDNIQMTGRNRGAFAYDYQAVIPQRAEISGEINLRSLAHTAHLRAQSLEPLIQPLIPAWPQPVVIDARWRGQPHDAGLEGRLNIASLNVAGNQAAGRIDLDARSGAVTLRPHDLHMNAVAVGVEALVENGRIDISSESVDIPRLRVRSDQGIAELHGQWRLADNQGAFDATWRELALPRGVVHSGDAHVDVRRRLDGQQTLTITTRNRGGAAGVTWEADLTIEALGQTWEATEWTLSAQTLDVAIADRALDLDGLRAVANVTPQRIVLEEMALQHAGLLEGQGEFRLDGERPWWLFIHGRRLPLPDYALIDAQVMVNAWGDQQSVRLEQVYARIGDLQITADGHFNPQWETPVVLKVAAFHPTPQGLGTDDDPPLRGGLDAEAFVLGTHQPLSLTFKGDVRGRNLRFQGREIGDVNVAIDGQMLPNLVSFKTTEGEVLGGWWSFNGRFDQRRRRSVAILGVRLDALPLRQVAELMDIDGAEGMLGGEWMITLPQRPEESVRVVGDFVATDIAYTPVSAAIEDDEADERTTTAPARAPVDPVVRIERATGRTILSNQRVRFENMVLTQADGEMRGSGSVGLDQPKRLNVDLLLRGWQIPIPNSPAGLRLSGTTDLLIDLERIELAGPIDMAADVVLDDQPAGAFSFAGRFNGRGVDLPDIRADLFGGRAWGRLTFDIDRPLRSTGTFQFRDLQSERIVELWPRMEGLDGRFQGLMHLRPAQPQTRPIAPLRFSGYITPDGPARYKHGEIGQATFDLYIDTRMASQAAGETQSLFRIVLDNATLYAFGGRTDLWGRYTRHRNGQISSQLNIDVADLQLNQIMQTIKEDDRPTPGLIDGSLTLVDNPLDRQRAFGQGSLQLRESELGNIRAFEFLYNLMNLGIDTSQPSGTGSLSLRLEGQTLLLQEMNYFNRGTEIRATGQFRNIWALDEAAVDATIVGIARPFRDIELPFMADVDDIFSAIQRNATTVRVSGTVGDPDVRQATLDEITQGLQGLFGGN